MTATAAGSPAADGPLPADLVRRFAGTLERLLPAGEPIGLAVSGGPDSMAMLLLAQAAVPGGFAVATVDHGVRPEAAAECALVERACAERAIACDVLRVKVGPGNRQAAARIARYGAMREWVERRGLRALATAHHADDQAETLLMRLNRGSGIAGLVGVRESGWLDPPACTLPLVRPLLGFRRAELALVIAAAGVPVVHDPSNDDARFDRVRIRTALAAADWLDPLAMAASASHLAEADEALAEFAVLLWERCVSPEGEGFAFKPLAPRLIRLRIVERIIRELAKEPRRVPRGGEVAHLVDRLERGEGGTLGGVLATVRGERWLFAPEPPRRA